MAVRFEKKEDTLREEKAVRLFLNGSARFSSRKLSPHEIDFEILEEESTFGYIEIKGVKKVPSVDSEHTPVVAVKKLTSLQRYINEKKCEHVYIAWAYEDGIKYAKVKDLRGTISWGGQYKPREGSVNDQELMFIDDGTKFKIKKYEHLA